MKKSTDIFNLITGNLDTEKRRKLFSEIKNEPENADLFTKAKIAWAFMSSTKQAPEYKIEQSYRQLQNRLYSTKRTFQLKTFYKYAASIVLFLAIGTTMYYLGRYDSSNATNLQYTSVVADYGQISKVVLPDSSTVWLNSGTTLTYNNKFGVNNRDLSLKGQAFLKVTKNKHTPLIVSSNDLKIKVLGTRFDVRAYPEDNQINVVLESGSVELLSTKNQSFDYYLKPGEMAEYHKGKKEIKINKINPANYTTWKDGELIFVNDPMADVIRRLERKFNVEIVVKNPRVYKSIFNANFKNESLKEILDYIEFTSPITYKLQTKKDDEKQKIILN